MKNPILKYFFDYFFFLITVFFMLFATFTVSVKLQSPLSGSESNITDRDHLHIGMDGWGDGWWLHEHLVNSFDIGLNVMDVQTI